MNLSTQNIENLLPLYFEGRLEKDGIDLVEAWIDESDENRNIAEQLHTIYFASDLSKVLPLIDTDKALEKVSGRINGKRKINWVVWLQRIAAILFIPLLAVAIFQYLNDEKPTPEMFTVRTNSGAITTVTLPDKTIVHLNSESELSYPSVFDADERKVFLRGGGYFEVAKDSEKQFIVSTPHSAEVAVYGTVFNLEAYEKDKELNLTLIEGKVGFRYLKENSKKEIRLIPGQKISFDIQNREASIKEALADCDTAWKDGKIFFRNTPFKDVLKVLSRQFNVEFSVQKQQFYDYTFTFSGTLNQYRLNEILEYLRLSSKINYHYKANKSSFNVIGEKQIIELY